LRLSAVRVAGGGGGGARARARRKCARVRAPRSPTALLPQTSPRALSAHTHAAGFAVLKKCAAKVNMEYGLMPKDVGASPLP
jgi:hypothetical protein